MFELEICPAREMIESSDQLLTNDEVVRAEGLVPETLRFVSIALNKVAVPDTVRLRVIRAFPIRRGWWWVPYLFQIGSPTYLPVRTGQWRQLNTQGRYWVL